MASVNQVYNTLKDLANKDQRGFVTPTVFNNFAPVAQAKIFNDLFQQLNVAKNMKLRGLDVQRHLSAMKQIEEDLSTFSKTDTVSQSNGTFAKPDDLAKIISLRTSGAYVFGTTTSTPIDVMYDEEKLEYILQSDLSKPSETAPVALLSDVIEVFPTTVKKIKIRYYKQPEGVNPTSGARTASMPKFGYDQSLPGGKEVYLAANSVDFELPDHYVPKLVIEIGKMVGINLRDEAVIAYGAQQQAQ
jgi:hypothetical protein